MAYSYLVSYSTSASGPWTSAGTVSTPTDVVTGLNAGTNYYFQVITTDLVTGFQSAPVVNGPFATSSSITGITLSNKSFTTSPGNIGTVAVQVSGLPFTGTLSLTGTNASSFTLTGTTLSVNTGVGAGTFNINIVATESNYVGSPFTQAFTITGTIASQETAAGTLVTTANTPIIFASSTPGTAGTTTISNGTAGAQNQIAITSAGTISVNGTVVGGSAVTALYYINHNCYQQNSAGNWYGPITATSVGSGPLTNPVPAVSGITLSASTVAPGAAIGTVVGTIVVATNNFTYSGTPTFSVGNATGESPAGTSVTTTTASIKGSSTPGTPGAQNVFTITTGGQVSVAANGGASTVIAATNGVVQLYYLNHGCYQLNSAGNWYGPMTATDGGAALSATPVVPASEVNLFSISGGKVVTLALLPTGSYTFAITTPALTASTTGGNTPVSIPAFTQLITVNVQASTSGSIQVPLAASLGTWFGDAGGVEGSMLSHWNDFVSEIGGGRALYGMTAVGWNAYQDYAGGTNFGGDGGSWNSTNMPTAAVTTCCPILTCVFTDGSTTDQDYSAFINDQWPGQAVGSVTTSVTNALAAFKNAGVTKMYVRMNWEFNTTGGPDNSGDTAVIPTNAANFVSAWKSVANMVHTWGANNGVNVRTVWCPDTNLGGSNTASTGNVINYFPAPDSKAVTGRYIDVIGPDWYMGGYGIQGPTDKTVATALSAGFTTTLSSNTNWCFGTFVKMCQTYGCNFGICETGGASSFADDSAWSDGTMAGFSEYLNTLSSLSPAVPIEFISIFDVTPIQVTGGNDTNMCSGWRCMFGNNPTQPSTNYTINPIMTIAPI